MTERGDIAAAFEAGTVQESAGAFTAPSADPLDRRSDAKRTADAAVIRECREHIRDVITYEDLQRRCEEEENEFEHDPWGEQVRTARDEHIADDGTEVAAKPTLQANLIDNRVEEVLAEARSARPSLTVRPKAGLATKADAVRARGLIKQIQTASGALSQRLWALKCATRTGRGDYRITGKYVDNNDFDIDLSIDRVLDPSSVFWDPASEDPGRRDARRCAEVRWLSASRRRELWPDKPLLMPQSEAWDDLGGTDAYTSWWQGTPEKPEYCRVVYYERVKDVERELGFHPQIGSQFLDEMPPEFAEAVRQGAPGTKLRKVPKRTVESFVLDGTQVLERGVWLGSRIPMVEVIGREYILKGRKRRFKGLLANAQDLMEAIDTVLSAAVQAAAQVPQSPYLMVDGQDDGFEEEWNGLYIENRTRIHYRAKDRDGTPAPAPQRQQTEAQVQGLLFLLRSLQDLLYSVIGGANPYARMNNASERSGRALSILENKASAGASVYLDNLQTISMPVEGEILLDALPHYYDRPGRVIRVEKGDDSGDEEAIMLRRPFIQGPEGLPVGVPCPACQGAGTVSVFRAGTVREQVRALFSASAEGVSATVPCQTCEGDGFARKANAPKEWNGRQVEYVDFSGSMALECSLDKDWRTRQEEALAGMSALANAAPQLIPHYADLWVKSLGFMGATAIADRLAAIRPGANMGEQMETLPPAVQAMLAQKEQEHQQAMQALAEAQKLLETDAVKAASAEKITVIKAALAEKLEGLKLQGKILAVREEGKQDAALEAIRGRIEEMRQQMEHRHEQLMAVLEARLEARTLGLEAQIQARASAVDHVRGEVSAVRADSRKEASAQTAAERDAAQAEAEARREQERDRTASED